MTDAANTMAAEHEAACEAYSECKIRTGAKIEALNRARVQASNDSVVPLAILAAAKDLAAKDAEAAATQAPSDHVHEAIERTISSIASAIALDSNALDITAAEALRANEEDLSDGDFRRVEEVVAEWLSGLRADIDKLIAECLEDDYETLADCGWEGGSATDYADFWLSGHAGQVAERIGDLYEVDVHELVGARLIEAFRAEVHNQADEEEDA